MQMIKGNCSIIADRRNLGKQQFFSLLAMHLSDNLGHLRDTKTLVQWLFFILFSSHFIFTGTGLLVGRRTG